MNEQSVLDFLWNKVMLQIADVSNSRPTSGRKDWLLETQQLYSAYPLSIGSVFQVFTTVSVVLVAALRWRGDGNTADQ